MSRRSPFLVILSDADRVVLEERPRAYSAPHAVVVRAKIVLLAADGERNAVIADRLDVHVGVVSRWRERLCEQELAGLGDRKRCGRPRLFAVEVVAEVKAMACEPPENRGTPLYRWSSVELARQAAAEGLVAAVSASSVRRWLAPHHNATGTPFDWTFTRADVTDLLTRSTPIASTPIARRRAAGRLNRAGWANGHSASLH